MNLGLNTIRRVLSASMLVALAASSAMANSISFSDTTLSTAAPFTNTFTLSNFNPAGETLTGVSVSLAYNTSDSVEFNCISANTGGACPTDVSSTDVLTLAAPTTSLTATSNGGPDAVSGVGTAVLTGFGSLSISIPMSDWSSYETPTAGSMDTYTFAASSASCTATGQGVCSIASADAGATTTITFTYTPGPPAPTPEPSSISLTLGGIGIVGLMVLRKRKSQGLV